MSEGHPVPRKSGKRQNLRDFSLPLSTTPFCSLSFSLSTSSCPDTGLPRTSASQTSPLRGLLLRLFAAFLLLALAWRRRSFGNCESEKHFPRCARGLILEESIRKMSHILKNCPRFARLGAISDQFLFVF